MIQRPRSGWFLLLPLLATHCGRARSEPSSQPIPLPLLEPSRGVISVDAYEDASLDATDGTAVATADASLGNCPERALPPDDLAVGSVYDGHAALGWSGREWAAAWTDLSAGESTIFFARIGADGRHRGLPVRVSERGYRGKTPAVVWNGENWNVAFSGGAGRLEEIWIARLDARGTLMGRPQRMTARNRRDYAPALSFNGRDMVATWSALMPENRWAIYALRMNRWGSQLGPAMRLADRTERLSSPTVVWNGAGWAAAWLVARSEAIAVDMARLEADVTHTRGYPARVTLGALGGTDLAARFGVAWDGTHYGVAWDEIRDGAPHVFFHAIGPRLDRSAATVMLSAPGEPATSPSLLSTIPDVFFAAWEVEHANESRVRVAAFDSDGRPLGEPVIVQGHDGRARSPALAGGDGALGLTTVTARGVSFHRVLLGPCPVRR